MFYLIGLGIGPDALSVRALRVLKNCEKIYLEAYTSVPQTDLKELESLTGRSIHQLQRHVVEETDLLLRDACDKEIAFIVPGDPLVATTHASLLLSARKNKIPYQILHASSIHSVIAECGLQLYKFGKTTTIPFPKSNYSPASPYDAIAANSKNSLHTLVLLDIQVTSDSGKYMTIPEALKILTELEKIKNKSLFTPKTKLVGFAHLGEQDQLIKYGTLSSLKKTDFGAPPHCLVYPADLHFQEKELLETYS